MDVLLPLLLGYLLGAIPFGLVITKAAGLGDIRTIGSGNIGATNVLRTGRKELALATLLLDGGKGAIAVGIAYAMNWRPEIAGAAAFFGHCYPVWLKFNGGKGVATFMGTLFALSLPAGLIAAGTWLISAFLTKYSSLSALIAAAAAPLVFYTMGKPTYGAAALVMTILIFIRHKENIKRLINHTEPKIGANKENADAGA